MDPVLGGSLFISDPNARKIYKLRSMSDKSLSRAQLTTNIDVVVGTGASCYPLQKGKDMS